MRLRNVTIISLLVLGMFAGTAGAQSDIGFKGIGGKVGFVSPSNIDGTIGFGVLANLGMITPEIGLEATIDYWSKSTGSGSLEFKSRDIAVGARGKYGFEVKNNPKLKPYAAAGLALHLFKFESPAVSTVFGTFPGVDESSTKIGVDLAGGVNYEAGDSFDIIGELGYRIVSDVGQFVIAGGVIFWLGGGDTAQ